MLWPEVLGSDQCDMTSVQMQDSLICRNVLYHILAKLVCIHCTSGWLWYLSVLVGDSACAIANT